MGYRKQSWQGWVSLCVAAGLIGTLVGGELWPAPTLLAIFGKAAWFFPIFLLACAARISLQNENAESILPIGPLFLLLPAALFLLAAGSDPLKGDLIGSVGETITRPVYLYGGKTALWLSGIGGMALLIFLFVRSLGLLERTHTEYALSAGEASHHFGHIPPAERSGGIVRGSARRALLRARKLTAAQYVNDYTADADTRAWETNANTRPQQHAASEDSGYNSERAEAWTRNAQSLRASALDSRADEQDAIRARIEERVNSVDSDVSDVRDYYVDSVDRRDEYAHSTVRDNNDNYAVHEGNKASEQAVRIFHAQNLGQLTPTVERAKSVERTERWLPQDRTNEQTAVRAFYTHAHTTTKRVPFLTRITIDPNTAKSAVDAEPREAKQPAEFPSGNIFPDTINSSDSFDNTVADEGAHIPADTRAENVENVESVVDAVSVADLADVADAENIVIIENAESVENVINIADSGEIIGAIDAADIPYEEPVLSKDTRALKHTKPIFYHKPDSSLLVKSVAQIDEDTRAQMQTTAKQLEQTFCEFGIEARVTNICRGPVITQYEVMVPPGIKLSRVVALQDNIALNLAAASVRIEAPIPGKAAIGIEVPNQKRSIVTLRDILESGDFQNSRARIPLALGETVSGDPMVADLASMPHLIIAGTTGSGKSVCVNSIICSILFHMSPSQARLILVDPKYVEMAPYNGIPHLLIPVINKPKDAILALRWLVREMEDRYQRLQSLGARNIESYNERSADEYMPYLILVIDELADLMLLAAKEIEDSISRLAAMSRAVGIHLIFATQRPSVDVLTGVIKNNFPARIAFQVASNIDSRTILDAKGADKLLGKGDSLFMGPGSPGARRVQGAFLSEAEVENTTDYLRSLGEPQYQMDILDDDSDGAEDDDYAGDANGFDDDPLYEDAVSIVLTTQRASASYLQRRLKIGYNRASRMVERMEKDGIIGPQIGSKPREIRVSSWP